MGCDKRRAAGQEEGEAGASWQAKRTLLPSMRKVIKTFILCIYDLISKRKETTPCVKFITRKI